MQRRKFLSLLGSTMIAWPFAARAQKARLHRIGYLSPLKITAASAASAFFQGLRELGYVEGQNIEILRKSADGDVTRLPKLAADLVRQKVEVIVGPGAVVRAAAEATRKIPIVITVSGDLVAEGWAKSLVGRAATSRGSRPWRKGW